MPFGEDHECPHAARLLVAAVGLGGSMWEAVLLSGSGAEEDRMVVCGACRVRLEAALGPAVKFEPVGEGSGDGQEAEPG